MWAALACALLAQTPIPVAVYGFSAAGPAPPSTVFDAPLDSNGLPAADPGGSWPVTGVGAPDVAWWGDDPTGSGGKTTNLFTLTGTTTEIDTPFCSDGSFDDVTSGCLKARRFDGTSDYYESNVNQIADCTDDCSVCALIRSEQAVSNGTIAMQKANGGDDSGWDFMKVIVASGGDLYFYVEDTSANLVSVKWDKRVLGLKDGWLFFCGTHDNDGIMTPYLNADADATSGSPPVGVTSGAVPMFIGSNVSSKHFRGDIVFVFYWDSLLDATDVEELFQYFAGILDNEGAPVTFANTGPTCMWVDGEIECYSDDWPVIGAELPPGVTGAGSPASGYYSGLSFTNSILGSRDLSAGGGYWSEGNGGEVTCSQSSTPFRDGRTTCKVTDNEGGISEYVKQEITHGLSNGNTIQFCVYAAADSPQVIDLRVTELNGTCSGGAQSYEFAAGNTTTAWTQYEWTHTVIDDSCTHHRITLFPHDAADGAGGTGHFYAVVQLFSDQDYCPPSYIETEGAAVTAGNDALVYDVGGVPTMTAWADGTEISFDTAQPLADFPVAAWLYQLRNLGAGLNYYGFKFSTAEKWTHAGSSNVSGAINMYVETDAWTFSEGVMETFLITKDDTTTTLSIDGTPEAGANNALGTAPLGLDTLGIGGLAAGSSQQHGGWVANFKVVN